MLRKLWHRRALCSVRCFKNGFHQTEQNLGHFISHPRPNDLGAAATLIRFRQSRCRIQWVTWSVVFELSGAQARPARKIFCKGAPVAWKAHMKLLGGRRWADRPGCG